MFFKEYIRFWKDRENKCKPCFNDGFILDGLKCIFFWLSKLSCLRFTIWRLEQKGHWNSCLYKVVDSYILARFILEISLSVFLYHSRHELYSNWLVVPLIIVVSYQMFDIFQTWVNQFILGEWNPISLSRTLVLVFIGYAQITLCYSFIAFFFRDQFSHNMVNWIQAFRYSIGNAVTIGSNYSPTHFGGYMIFASQLGFTLLFITAVVSRIISGKV
jgi:hypothetical protein